MVDILTAAMGAKMASGAVQSQIDTALTSVYKYKGQCTNSELANKTKTAGDVWEITDAGTFAAGTDVVCDGTNWSAMTGHLHVNVVDNLTTQSSTDALSANMGYSLATSKQDKLTAGTGISISAENVISATGGGGGSWVKRTSNDDWSDILGTSDSAFYAIKDILMVIDGWELFIPKGYSVGLNESMVFKTSAGNYGTFTSNKLPLFRTFMFGAYIINSTYTNVYFTLYGIEFDLANDTITEYSQASQTTPKRNVIIYTKD